MWIAARLVRHRGYNAHTKVDALDSSESTAADVVAFTFMITGHICLLKEVWYIFQ